AELVDEDRPTKEQDDQEDRPDVQEEGLEGFGLHFYCKILINNHLNRATSRAAPRRASESTPRTALRSEGSKLAVRSRALLTIAGIARKGILPPRKASTAISLAALNTAGAMPPAAMHSLASRIMGKRTSSMGLNSSETSRVKSIGGSTPPTRSG